MHNLYSTTFQELSNNVEYGNSWEKYLDKIQLSDRILLDMLVYPQHNSLEDEISDYKNKIININTGFFFADNLIKKDG